MHSKLIDYINDKLGTKLTEEESSVIRSAFTLKKYRKHQYFLQEGEVCKIAGFVVKGALKQFTIDDSGKENILGLFIENWWVGDRESHFNGTPSPYNISVVEDSEILIITKPDLNDKLKDQAFMVELRRVLTEKQAYHLMKMVHASKTFTAEQRLSELENTYPEFLQRFPQHIIASYLGMTKETLSRVRAQASKKL